jgi:predicted PurR-regulated permease PerM
MGIGGRTLSRSLPTLDRRRASRPDRARHGNCRCQGVRRRLSLGVLITMAAAGITLCVLMVWPFVPGLVWALGLAVAAMPVHRRLLKLIKQPNVAAGLSVAGVAVILLTPAVLVGWQVGVQAARGLDAIEAHVQSAPWRQTLRRFPILTSALQVIAPERPPEQSSKEIVPEIKRQAGVGLLSVGWGALQLALALFTLFFLFRDRDEILDSIRTLLPMTDEESTYFFERVRGMTHATIYGTLTVALIQGGLGGLMFMLLGLPSPLLWGFAMAVMAMLPGLGTLAIWLPAAIFLAVQDEWTKALILFGWGALVVSTIDNLLYPMLVGREGRLHTLPVFLTIIGGLMVFGAAGIVLGPVVLAATVALIDIMRRRTIGTRAAKLET